MMAGVPADVAHREAAENPTTIAALDASPDASPDANPVATEEPA
jgi:hypothetical protein